MEQPFGAYPLSETSLDNQQKILAFSAIVEIGTGLALMVDPVIVVSLLVGADLSGVGVILGRCFGIALVSLSLACWPKPPRTEGGSPAFRAMLTYNSLIALYLAYLGALGHLGGFLLWPAAVIHAVVALLLMWTSRAKRQSRTGK
jgi:Ca2+/Na+ antiporter